MNNDGTINNPGTFINQCGAIFINAGTYIGNPVFPVECSYSLILFEGCEPPDFECSESSDGFVNLNQNVAARVQTNDVSVDNVTFTWTNQDGLPVRTVLLSTGRADMFAPDQVGEWTVETRLSNGIVVRQTLSVSFMVIPESPIGIIALMGSSLAALGGFILVRRKRGNSYTGSHADSGL